MFHRDCSSSSSVSIFRSTTRTSPLIACVLSVFGLPQPRSSSAMLAETRAASLSPCEAMRPEFEWRFRAAAESSAPRCESGRCRAASGSTSAGAGNPAGKTELEYRTN